MNALLLALLLSVFSAVSCIPCTKDSDCPLRFVCRETTCYFTRPFGPVMPSFCALHPESPACPQVSSLVAPGQDCIVDHCNIRCCPYGCINMVCEHPTRFVPEVVRPVASLPCVAPCDPGLQCVEGVCQ